MNREWAISSLASAFVFTALSACATDGGDESTPGHDVQQGNQAQQGGQAQHEQQFPVRADIISDVLGGAGDTSSATKHGDPPLLLTTAPGPFFTDSYDMATGTVFYPVDADPPFAALSLCAGFLNVGVEMTAWGPFLASWGLVTVITTTSPFDFPADRADELLGSIDELKGENTNPLSPLYGKLNGRYGTSGYSMGGGGTTMASAQDWSLLSSVGLAPWTPTGLLVQTPTLLMCGDVDVVAPCEMAQAAYDEMSFTTPKMLVTIGGGTDHFSWFGPDDASFGASGEYALAFHKTFLEGDERWKPLLLGLNAGIDLQTNIF